MINETLHYYNDDYLEETAQMYLRSIRGLIKDYAEIHEEAVRRRIPSFLDPNVQLLSDDDRQPVMEYVKSLSTDELIQAVHRYKTMPTCLRITLDEIRSRLKKI